MQPKMIARAPVPFRAFLLILTCCTPVAFAEQSTAKIGVTTAPADLATLLSEENQEGVLVLSVAPASPADKAGIQPGDRIARANNTAVSSLGDLATVIQQGGTRQAVSLQIHRGGQTVAVQATPVLTLRELDVPARERTLAFLKAQQPAKDGPTLRRELGEVLWLLGRREEALAEVVSALGLFPDAADLANLHLDYLHKTGRFREFVTATGKVAPLFPQDNRLQLFQIEAYFATGQLREAENLTASLAKQSLFPPIPAVTNTALQQWVLARLRQGKSLEDSSLGFAGLRWVWDNPGLASTRFWREQIKHKPTYQVRFATPAGTPVPQVMEVPLHETKVLWGLAPQRMKGITIQVNGTEVPLAIVDTGASHTLLSNTVAEATKIPLSTSSHAAVGSLGFAARHGFVRELRIGDVIIENVPVAVGNPPPLVMTKAQAALGLDLMFHLRFTIDYARRKVLIEPASIPAPAPQGEFWDIPLWTFADHSLTQGEMPDGRKARVLIDSGNFAYTLVWPTWARLHLPAHQGSKSLLIYALSDPRHEVNNLRLGERTLPPWPVMDMPPVSLEEMDMLDLLMGNDLLDQYRVTVDVANRRLRLEPPHGKKLAPPKAPPILLGL